MEKITYKSISNALSQKEMKNVSGGSGSNPGNPCATFSSHETCDSSIYCIPNYQVFTGHTCQWQSDWCGCAPI